MENQIHSASSASVEGRTRVARDAVDVDGAEDGRRRDGRLDVIPRRALRASTSMAPNRRHAYDAEKTLVMCVRKNAWHDAYARDGDEEARRRCEILPLKLVEEGDHLRAVSDDDATELWALVSRVAIGVESEQIAQYKARFFPGDDDFELGGFACSTDSDVRVSAPPPRLQSEDRGHFEGHPLYGCVEVTYFDIDRLVTDRYEDGDGEMRSLSFGWNVSAGSTSMHEYVATTQAYLDGIWPGRFVARKRGKYVEICLGGFGEVVYKIPRDVDSTNCFQRLPFTTEAGVRMRDVASATSELLRHIVDVRNATRDVILRAGELVERDVTGLQRVFRDNRVWIGSMNMMTGHLNLGVETRSPVTTVPWDDDDDIDLWWATGLWLGDGSVLNTCFAIGLTDDENVEAAVEAANTSTFNVDAYGRTEFGMILARFQAWEAATSFKVSDARIEVLDDEHPDGVIMRRCASLSVESPLLKEHLIDMDVFDDKTVPLHTARRCRDDLSIQQKLAFLCGLIDSDGTRSLRDVDSVEFNQAILPRDDAIRPNAARGHDTILSLSALVACSIDIDARMDLRRQYSQLPYQEERVWRTRGGVCMSSPTQRLACTVLGKRCALSRPEKIFTRTGASFGQWSTADRRARTAEVHLVGTSRMVLANGTVVAVNKHEA